MDVVASKQKSNKALFDTVKSGDFYKLENLLTKSNVNAMDAEGNTLLHHATHKKIVELLLAKGANVNARNKLDYTPLHGAKTREIAQCLIDGKADLHAKKISEYAALKNPNNPQTPLISAMALARPDVACCIMENFSLEDLNQKPNYLKFPYSEHWDEIKQKKEIERSTTESKKEVLKADTKRGDEKDIASNVQPIRVKTRLGACTLFSEQVEETNEEAVDVDKQKGMVKSQIS
ncbi:MAG: ankyrin repeat domain-containing protein [Candidatus Aquirickettsiella sp.]